ncbi:MAG: hypothetical protein P4L83_21130 [Nevskia sp.]|nr:hypothetical protein [Nevskia sp.]
MIYTDILGKAADRATVVAAVAAMRAAGLHDLAMLGDPVLDAQGNELARTLQASAEKGDGVSFYFAGRTVAPAAAGGVDVTAFGLAACTAEECAAVLGVWA